MRSKIKKIIITVIVLCAIGIPVGKHWYNSHEIQFKDENMRRNMVLTSGYRHGGYETSHENLNEIKRLWLGYIGYYNTLEDLKWAKNVEEIEINVQPPIYEWEPAYVISKGEVPEEVSKEKVKQYEKELGKILPKLKKLKEVSVVSDYGCEWDSIAFLKDCDQIEDLSLIRFKVKDFSVLKQCKSLESISLCGAQIEKAEDLDLTGLKRLRYLYISDTPLAENLEEVKKLQETYPQVEIYYGK